MRSGGVGGPGGFEGGIVVVSHRVWRRSGWPRVSGAFRAAMANEIDFVSVRQRLNVYRNESANWLKSALEL